MRDSKIVKSDRLSYFQTEIRLQITTRFLSQVNNQRRALKPLNELINGISSATLAETNQDLVVKSTTPMQPLF